MIIKKILVHKSSYVFYFLVLVMSCASDDNPKNDPFPNTASQETVITLKNANPAILVGSPLSPSSLDIPKYVNIPEMEFSAGQALWYARWDGWLAAREYNFTNLNKVIDYMHENQLISQVHMIVGPDFYMPDWLLNGTWSKEELDALLKDLIIAIMDDNDNNNKVDTWNVVNEAFDQDGSYSEMFWNQLGWEEDTSGLTGEDKINDKHPIFIRKAFEYSREKTANKLEYRDYLIESSNPANGWDKKQKAAFQLMKHMLNSNIPIDAIGIQGHHDIGKVDWVTREKGVREAVEKFRSLDLEVHMTEVDMGTKDRSWSSELAEQQESDYFSYIKEAIEGGASRIYTWGIQDGLDTGWRTNEHPLPWDENLEKKPAYFGILQALEDSK
jgi:endo-1,4-beta-xylanase